MHAGAGSRSVRVWRLLGWCLPVLLAPMGCSLPLRLQVEQAKLANPGMVPWVQLTGLIDLVPAAELGQCGPNRMLAGLIPDCPLPGVCFTAACANHDICYSTCGTTQDLCDHVFFWDMVYICDLSISDFAGQNRCYSVAWIYYRVVELYGPPFFANTQAIVCDAVPADPADTGLGDTAARVAAPCIPAPFVDEDNDLMPDEWELEVMLDPADPHDALLDYDGDGLVNLTEYILNSDPYLP